MWTGELLSFFCLVWKLYYLSKWEKRGLIMGVWNAPTSVRIFQGLLSLLMFWTKARKSVFSSMILFPMEACCNIWMWLITMGRSLNSLLEFLSSTTLPKVPGIYMRRKWFIKHNMGPTNTRMKMHPEWRPPRIHTMFHWNSRSPLLHWCW